MIQGPAQRRFPWWAYWLVLAFVVAFTVWPIASVALASFIADANGCQLNEGSINACIVVGQDLGEMLYILGVLGGLMLVTLPLGLGALIVWLIILLIHRAAWRNVDA